jgi:pyrimidine-nucleoside phosphorylase
MNPVEIIRKKRNRGTLSRAELEEFLGAYVRDDIPDYQMSAFLMAVYFSGMTQEETLAFTDVMLRSGKIVDLSAIPGLKVDKHSTGGVGDKVSLILAPMVASCGVPVPMISGRGLGHTGGTLDKLESIPGFRTDLPIEEYVRVIEDVGLVLMGQTREIVPADRKMYALRDVTATIESIPLIAGSIMSKKLAEGIDALVLDVKTGNGAFMHKAEDALALAQTLVGIGTGMGKETVGFITAMDQPLGRNVGNWLELIEAVECLRGKNVPDLMEVTTVLGGAMVWVGRKAHSIEEGMRMCRSAIWSGEAYERFLACVRRQGGDPSCIERPGEYPKAKHVLEVRSLREGTVRSFDTTQVGMLAIDLGAGRRKLDDRIDPKAGMVFHRKIGDRVRPGDVLAEVHTDREGSLEDVTRRLVDCIEVGSGDVRPGPRILTFIDRTGAHPWVTPAVH